MLPKKRAGRLGRPADRASSVDPVPAPTHPHCRTSPLPERAGGCGYTRSELGGEATSGGESCPVSAPGLPSPLPFTAALRDSPVPVSPLPFPSCCHRFQHARSRVKTKGRQKGRNTTPALRSFQPEVQRVTKERDSSGGKTDTKQGGFPLPRFPGAHITARVRCFNTHPAPAHLQGLYIAPFVLLTVLKGHFPTQEDGGTRTRRPSPPFGCKRATFV